MTTRPSATHRGDTSQVEITLAVLFETVKTCADCRTKHAAIRQARGDVGDAATKLRGAITYSNEQAITYWRSEVPKRKSEIDTKVEDANKHLAEVEHADPTDKPLRRKRAASTTQCGRCGKRVPLVDGQPKGHNRPQGRRCVDHAVDLDELPDVTFARTRERRPSAEAAEPKRSRLDVGSNCAHCAKWLPGERSLCGQCARKPAHKRGPKTPVPPTAKTSA